MDHICKYEREIGVMQADIKNLDKKVDDKFAGTHEWLRKIEANTNGKSKGNVRIIDIVQIVTIIAGIIAIIKFAG